MLFYLLSYWLWLAFLQSVASTPHEESFSDESGHITSETKTPSEEDSGGPAEKMTERKTHSSFWGKTYANENVVLSSSRIESIYSANEILPFSKPSQSHLKTSNNVTTVFS